MITTAEEPKIFEEITISSETPIKISFENMDNSGLGILLVCDQDNRLIGVVTDGDIRRYLLKNESLSAPVSKLMNQKYFSLPIEKKNSAHEIIKNKKIDHIPIIDNKGHVVDLVTALDFVKTKRKSFDNPVVIMAGGKGTRLSPLTKIIPKPLMPIGEKTMIEMIMDNFMKSGFHDIRIIVNYKKELIKSYFNENKISQHVRFIEENEYLGTAGGLCLLQENIDRTFVLTNCDILAEMDYELMLNWHLEHKADITILGVRKKVAVPYGVIKLDPDNFVNYIDEKPNFSIMIMSGIYVLEPSVFEFVSDKCPLGMDELIKKIITSGGKVTCYPIDNGWVDIGQIEGYKKMLSRFGLFND